MAPKETYRDWAALSKKEHPSLFSELDILLRGIDRFFNIENLPISNEEMTGRNFYEELLTVRDAILRVISILEVIIPDNRKNAYWFGKFAETKFMSERRADAFRKDLYLQDSPEKGLYLLYDSFVNLKGLITDLIRSGHISYMGFTHIGNVVSKEIRENIFFNPFRMNMNPEFDIITNHAISGIVKSLPDREEKKHISIIYFYLFRFIRIMGFMELSNRRSVSLNSSLVLLVLLRSEVNSFRSYIEKSGRRLKDEEMKMLLAAISYQFSMETRRVYQQELKDVFRKKASVRFLGMLENSFGILKNLTEQSVVQLTQHYSPEIKGEEVFSSFMNRLEQSLRLREDIHVLHALTSLFCSTGDSSGERTKCFESLRSYMVYFESLTFRLLRHDDYEEFSVFFHDLYAMQKLVGGRDYPKVIEKAGHFKIYLETTLRHIGNRSELADRPVDTEKVDELMRHYL